MPVEKKYGSWTSPINASLLQKYELNYTYLCQDQCDDAGSMIVYWIELRSVENGRNVVVSRNIDVQDSENITWTVAPFSARSRVHEYGGADIFVHRGIVYFSNDSDQHLYLQTRPQLEPIKVSKKEACRYANGFFSTKLNGIFIVREDHNDKKKVINTIVAIRDDEEVIVTEGADFYSSPRVSGSGSHMCWVEWNFPNMPWDNTRICTAELDASSMKILPGSLKILTNNQDCDPLSCILPMWTRNNSLLYVKDETGFWNVWINTNVNEHLNLTPVNEEIGSPLWQFDNRKYNYSAIRDQLVVAKNEGKLEIINLDGSQKITIELQSMLSFFSHPQLMKDGSVVVIGYSSDSRKTIYHIIDSEQVRILGRNRLLDDIDVQYISIPKLIKYPVPNSFSYGHLYLPCNPDYCGLKGTLPPLIVHVHGGPTSAASTDWKFKIQYWTSRGFAIFDVDYRGSTGYGKEYRHLLRGNWGVYDIQDCSEGVKYLVEQNLVDGNLVAISGGSAGGYTVLACLAFTSTFKAGCSLYGIGDLKSLIEDTHKFEMKYMDLLIGDYESNADLYRNRSPINFPENIKCPVIFFQGDQDKVVPKEQSERMFQILKDAGIPCSLNIYRGEGHGFRKVENLIHQVENEYYFYGRIFEFSTPGITSPAVRIDNLD